MAEVVGAGSFARGSPTEVRWEALLQSGSRTGVEFAAAWAGLKEAGEAAARWVVEAPASPEVPYSLQVGAEGAGRGCVSGATRKVVTDELEEVQGKERRDRALQHRMGQYVFLKAKTIPKSPLLFAALFVENE